MLKAHNNRSIQVTDVYNDILEDLKSSPKKWMVSGVAGFIGSNLLENLLMLGQHVVGLDNFATGHQRNLDEVQAVVSEEQWNNFEFINGDIRNMTDCQRAIEGADYILHQAALGSVPRSLKDPITSNDVNISGMLNVLVAAKDAGVKSMVYAASSSTYGDHPGLPKVENVIGSPLSPYAVTKFVNELYASVFYRAYGLKATGLRYFNVFGPRQDPDGAYAAVIPKWANATIQNETIVINGDGETSRDFCYIDNVVQMNILAAVASDEASGEVYNVAFNARTSLNELKDLIYNYLQDLVPHIAAPEVQYGEFRAGDVRHSQADISKAKNMLGYDPVHDIKSGLKKAMPWYLSHRKNNY